MAKDFRAYVLDTMARLKSDFGWSQDGDAFAHFAICHVSLLSEREVYEDVYVGAKDDKSLDGFYIDDGKDRVDLFQCKYQQMTGSYGDRADLVDFVNVVHRMADEKASKLFKRPEIRRCARRYRGAIEDKYSVVLKFIAYGTPTPSVLEEAEIQEKKLPPRHKLEIWGFRQLEDLYADLLSFDEPITDTITLKLNTIDHLNMQTPKAQAVVVSLPAQEIYDLRKKYGNKLFAKDVRYFLGQTPINKQIANTLESPSDRPFFWYYNNGISVSCSNYSEIDEKSMSIEVSKPQIINGCQTAESIFKYAEKKGYHNIKNVSVLARIIKTADKDIGQNITARTNTQNPQSVRNLCANFSSQLDLKQLFDDLKFPVFYQTKDGEWGSLPQFKIDRYTGKDKVARIIDNIDAAQAYIAFSQDTAQLNPVEARRKQSEVFDITKKYYAQVFPDEPRTPYEYLVPNFFLKYVENRLKEIRRELDLHSPKNREETELDEIKGSLRYAKWFLVGIIGCLVRKHYGIDKLDARMAKLLYPAIGDFTAPSELGKYMIELATQAVEEYSDDHMSHEEGDDEEDEEEGEEEDEEMGDREEFDPALAYRRGTVWRALKRKVIRQYVRSVEKGAFRADLFPVRSD